VAGGSTAGLLLLLCLSPACRSQQPEKPRQGTLYQRVGNRGGLEAVIEEFLRNAATDPRLSARFGGAEQPRMRKQMMDQLCTIVGGPCAPEGSPEAGPAPGAQAGLRLGAAEFPAFMEVMVQSMNNVALPQKEQNDILDALAGMQDQIVVN
jgi:hemoglobin